MPIRDYAQHHIVCISPQASVLEAARLMRASHVGDLVVTKEGLSNGPVGILTDRDIVTLVVALDASPASVKVEDIMARHVHCAHESDSLHEVTQRMRDNGVRRLPVLNNAGQLTGLVTADDLYRIFADEFRNLASVSTVQIASEGAENTLMERFS